jgi:hypothetical protein
MRKSLCASVLALALCGSTLAGDMGTPPIAPGDIINPPKTSPANSVPTTDDLTDAGAPDPTADVTHNDDLAAIALSAINSVLALL